MTDYNDLSTEALLARRGEIMQESSKFENDQMVIKILLNSLYGALG